MCSNKLKLLSLIVIATVLIISFSTAAFSDISEDTLGLDASSAILVDSNTHQVLYEKNSKSILHVSSASKIMTTLIAIEKTKPDAKVTISKDITEVSGSILRLEVGKKYVMDDLLAAVMLTSSNDVAVAIAEHVGGETDTFVEMMNAKAKELGMTNTVFKNPTGLFDDKQYTTAEDLSKLVTYSLENPSFRRYFSIRGLPWNDEDNSQILVNRNKLFWSYDGIIGGKTGYNSKDKQSAINAASRNNLNLISIILDSTGDKVFDDSVKLLDYGFNNYKYGILVQSGEKLKAIEVNGLSVNLICNRDVYYTYPNGSSNIKNIEFNITKDIKLPLTKDKLVGTAVFLLDDGTKIDVNLYPDRDLKLPETTLEKNIKKLTDNMDIFVLLVILVILEIILIIYNIAQWIKKKFRAAK